VSGEFDLFIGIDYSGARTGRATKFRIVLEDTQLGWQALRAFKQQGADFSDAPIGLIGQGLAALTPLRSMPQPR
jgi:hypothetical protein